MKRFLLVVVAIHLAFVSGAPNAEAIPEADAEAEAKAEAVGDADADPQYQYGGPGVNRSRPWPASWYGGASQGQMSQEVSGRYYGNPTDIGPYGSLSITSEGNVLPMEGGAQMSEQITGNYAVTLPAYGYSQQTTNGGSLQASYGASEGSYVYQQASAPVYQQSYYQPSPPVYQRPPLYTPAATLPAAPVFGSAPLINNQNQIFTRSYTAIPGSNCMNVCRQRPVYNARPTCGTACNVRPACQMTQPMVDYAVSGNTLACRPRPIYNPPPIMQSSGCGTVGGCGQPMVTSSGCGMGGCAPLPVMSGGCGTATGCLPAMGAVTLPESAYSSSYAETYPSYGQGYNPGMSVGYSSSGSVGYNPGVSVGYTSGSVQSYSAAPVQSYTSDQTYYSGSVSGPCLGSGCGNGVATSSAGGCGPGGCSYQSASTLPQSLSMTYPGPVSAVTLPEKISWAQPSVNVNVTATA